MKTPNTYISIGQFCITSNEAVVSDPCYSLDDWCSTVVKNIRPGIYNAFVRKNSQGRCVELCVIHDSIKRWPGQKRFKEADFLVYVDSGQAGVFDLAHYQDASVIEEQPKFDVDDKWYAACCDQTVEGIGAGVIPFGAVSSSGCGDGIYDAQILKNGDDIIAIKLLF